jgi:Flp pilus assembly protein TadD
MSRAMAMLLLLAWAIPSHAATQSAQEVEAELTAPPELVAALPPQARDRHRPTMERVQAIVDFMTGDDGLALRYREQPTTGVAESYARREVNCLSFTLMFVALARANGIRANAQASDEVLAAGVLDGMAYRVTHMNAGVEVDGKVVAVDIGWRDVLAEREPHRISDARAVALLHNNRAVEWLLQGDIATATAEIGRALALDPSNATGWSNAGVVHARGGRIDIAERDYLQALKLSRDHIGALGNLVGLYRARGDAASADAYEARLERARAGDPFSQFLLGQQQAQVGAYADAIAHYRRAIRLLPREPVFFRGLAEAYRRSGDASAARPADGRAEALEAAMAERRGIRDADGS